MAASAAHLVSTSFTGTTLQHGAPACTQPGRLCPCHMRGLPASTTQAVYGAQEEGSQGRVRRGLAATAAASLLLTGLPALADLNKFEAGTRGEFGIGSAVQFGSADLKYTKHANENFRRGNFTSADMRFADFSGSNFVGAVRGGTVCETWILLSCRQSQAWGIIASVSHVCIPSSVWRQVGLVFIQVRILELHMANQSLLGVKYLEKAVAAGANFEGADFTDTLMDRMVLNEANLNNALLVRAVLTRSDLGKAKIEGADFSDSVLDLQQKQDLCKYASGVNPMTGMETRKSLGCGNKRKPAYGTPSAPELSGPATKFLTRDGFCDESTGQCKAGSLN